MARLRRVPLCKRVIEQPRYREQLKIKFNHDAYRTEKPECGPKRLSFRRQSVDEEIEQEILLCPGRHDPLRSHPLLDDHRDLLYVSSGAATAAESTKPISAQNGVSVVGNGPTDSGSVVLAPKSTVPGSIVVYKREWDADTEQYYVYDVIDDIHIETLEYGIATEFDAMDDLKTVEEIAYNNDLAELEIIYIREMMRRPEPALSERDKLLEKNYIDTLANCYESELDTLCHFILDRPQYQEIGFQPLEPPPQPNEMPVTPDTFEIRFQHSVEYNSADTRQKMYTCKPRPRRTEVQANQEMDPKRIQISRGPRPNSYMTYVKYPGDSGVYRLHEFIENLLIQREETPIAVAAPNKRTEEQLTNEPSAEPDSLRAERKFMEQVHTNMDVE